MFIPNKKKSLIIQGLNRIVNVLTFPKTFLSKKADLKNISPKRILMLRLDHVGDVVMTSPAFTSVRKRFPDAKISLLTDSVGQQLFSEDFRIDEIKVFNWPWKHQKNNNLFTWQKIRALYKIIREIRKEKIDLLIDFRGDIRFVFLFGVLGGAKIRISNSRCGNSKLLHSISTYDVYKHEVERSLDVLECLGQRDSSPVPLLDLREQEISDLKKLVESETENDFPSKLAVIAPYSAKDVKSWPVNYFREVISHLSSAGFTVIVVGTRDDENNAERMISAIPGKVYSFAGKTSIRQLAALVSSATLVIGVDTGVLHIASCFKVPIIAIFGSTRSVEFRPYSPLSHVLETHTCQCNQFLYDKCDYPVNGYAKCLSELNPAAVTDLITTIIQDQLLQHK